MNFWPEQKLVVVYNHTALRTTQVERRVYARLRFSYGILSDQPEEPKKDAPKKVVVHGD